LAWLHVSINRGGKESRHRLQKEDVELLKQILRLLDGWGMGDGDAIEWLPSKKCVGGKLWKITVENGWVLYWRPPCIPSRDLTQQWNK